MYDEYREYSLSKEHMKFYSLKRSTKRLRIVYDAV